MKLNEQKIIKYNTAIDINQSSANDDFYDSPDKDIEKELNSRVNNVIYINEHYSLKAVFKLAFEHKAKLELGHGIIYDFSYVKVSSNRPLEKYLTLVGKTTDSLSLECVVDIFSDELKNLIPYRYSFKYVKAKLKNKINKALDVAKAIEQFEANYNQHLIEVSHYIKPAVHPKIKQKRLCYESELFDFLLNNDGIFVLNGSMGAGKSTYGITKPFEHWCREQKIKPVIVTPDIALSKQILDDSDNRHYLNESLRQSLHTELPKLAGLVCCANSLTTKDEFFEFAQYSGVVMIEEIEECLLSLTQPLIKSGKLSERVEATARLFELLQKDKVIIADALFSNLTATQIIEQTGRDIYLIEPSNIESNDRNLTLTDRNSHFSHMISSIQSGKGEVCFSDQGQTQSRKFFESFDIVNRNVKERLGKGIKSQVINAQFLKTKKGKNFLSEFESNISNYDYVQISPSLTSGLNFPFEKVENVNLFASQTIIPTQLIQSSGRFRKAAQLMLSFTKFDSEYHTEHEELMIKEVIEHCPKGGFQAENIKVRQLPHTRLVLERMSHNNQMRKNYENNTLIMFQHLGVNIEFDSHPKPEEKYLSKLTVEQLLNVKTLQSSEYKSLKAQYDGLDEQERLQLAKYECLSFFNVLDKPDLHKQVLTFDNLGNGRKAMEHLRLINAGDDRNLSLSEELTRILLIKILDILNIDSKTFAGSYLKEDIREVERFLKFGSIDYEGHTIVVTEIKSDFLKLKSAVVTNEGALSTRILKNNFSLAQVWERKRAKGSDERYRIYSVCPESITELLQMFKLAYPTLV